MKVQVKKVPVTVDNSKNFIKQAPRVRPTPFIVRFLRVCKHDIEDKIARITPKKKHALRWNGDVPTIEPRYK